MPPDPTGVVTVFIDLVADDVSIYSLGLSVSYDDSQARLIDVTKGDIVRDWLSAINTQASGNVRMAFAGAEASLAQGRVATLRFELLDGANRSGAQVTAAEIDEGAVQVIFGAADGHTYHLPLVFR